MPEPLASARNMWVQQALRTYAAYLPLSLPTTSFHNLTTYLCNAPKQTASQNLRNMAGSWMVNQRAFLDGLHSDIAASDIARRGRLL